MSEFNQDTDIWIHEGKSRDGQWRPVGWGASTISRTYARKELEAYAPNLGDYWRKADGSVNWKLFRTCKYWRKP